MSYMVDAHFVKKSMISGCNPMNCFRLEMDVRYLNIIQHVCQREISDHSNVHI